MVAGSPMPAVLVAATIRHGIVLQYECAGTARLAGTSLGNVGRGTARISQRDHALRGRVRKKPRGGRGGELCRSRRGGRFAHRPRRLREINSAPNRLRGLLCERGG